MGKSIRMVTPVPGPKAQELLARRQAAVPRGVANVAPVFVEQASGATVTDVDGNVFLDFAGGIGVLNVGHAHPEVNAAVHRQVDRFLHTCFHVAMYEGYVRLAETLAELAPGHFPKKTLLVSTGAEAVENAVKIARRFTGRPAVIAFENAFHGRTLMGLSLTAKANTYKYGFGPFAPEVYRAPFPNLYRTPFATEEETVNWCLERGGALHQTAGQAVAPNGRRAEDPRIVVEFSGDAGQPVVAVGDHGDRCHFAGVVDVPVELDLQVGAGDRQAAGSEE